MNRCRLVLLLTVVVVWLASQFIATGAHANQAPSPKRNAAPVTIFAATSVGDVVQQVAAQAIGADNIRVNVASSSTLARQAAAGAHFDLFVSANETWVQRLVAQEKLRPNSVQHLAQNSIVVGVPRGHTLAVGTFPRGQIAVAASHVPLGQASDVVLSSVGASPNESLSESLEGRIVRASSARAALEWVAQAEVGAGLLYRSDVKREDRVDIAWTPAATQSQNLAVVAGISVNADPRAMTIVDALASSGGQRAFAAAHFVGVSTTTGDTPASGATTLPQPSAVEASVYVDTSDAILRSLLVAILSLLLCAPFAIGAGYFLSRRQKKNPIVAMTVSAVLLVPLALPPVVTGWLLLVALGNRGLGTTVPFTLAACVIAAAVVALPLFALTARAAFETVDPRLTDLALTLGAPPRFAFWRVTLPLAFPGLAAGALLAFARGMGEFGATVVVAGNTEGETRTLALAVDALLHLPEAGNALWTLVAFALLMTVAVVVAYELLLRWQRTRNGSAS